MRKISLALILVFFSFNLFSQVLTEKQIDSLVERTRKEFNVPGIAVGLIKDGKLIHAKGYGVRSLTSNLPVDENTLFGIASNTKAFTVAALGILIDEGRLQWDDKVVKYIPEFQLYDPWVTKEFTVRDLLCHRSGMGLGAGDLMFFPDSSDFSTADVIHNLRYLKPVSSFRSKYDYDNNLYIVAGEVIARISGMSWDDFIDKRILHPLGMNKTASSYGLLPDKSNVIGAHAEVEGILRVISRHSGKADHAAGSIYSSVADLSKWVLMQLNHGKYDGNKTLFTDKVHEEMWAPQTILPSGGPGWYGTNFRTYGLGFGVSDVKGYKQLNHTGGLPGNVTQITLIPGLDLGIIVLTNQQEGSAFSAIANQIKDGYLNMPARDWVKFYSDGRKQSLAQVKKITDSVWNEIDKIQKQATPIDFNVFTGTYKDPWLGDVSIVIKNGKSWFISKRSPKLTGEIFPFKDNTYIVKWNERSMDADAYIMFAMDKGKPVGMTMKAISPLTDFSYDFHDLDFKKIK